MTAIAGVLLFAAAYTVGSAVSRIAQDFFNDDDLFFRTGHRVLRMAATEDRIITSVLCDSDDNDLLQPQGNSKLAEKISAFQSQKSGCCGAGGDKNPQAPAGAPPEHKQDHQDKCEASEQKPCCQTEKDLEGPPAAGENSISENGVARAGLPHCLCDRIPNWKARFRGYEDFVKYNDREDEFIETARDIFRVQENSLLLKGEDATLRLRQLHDQIMVLRGGAFNGIVTFFFCFFAWGARERRAKPRSALRWALAAMPIVPLFFAVTASTHHFAERSPTDPPYMEFSLFIIGLAGALLLWPPPSNDSRKHPHGPRWKWPGVGVLAAVLTMAVVLGWWATEVLYVQQVIYSYDSQTATPPKP